MTIPEIRATLDELDAAGVPQWKQQLALEEAQAARQIVAYGPKGEPFTRERLLAQFKRVANATNWKLPIDVTLDLEPGDQDALTEAVRFFAGCATRITRLGGIAARVVAEGYYNAVGA